jgi:hypothetical protein
MRRAGKPNLLQDPSTRYTVPERLLRDRGLSDRAKRALLQRWRSTLTGRSTLAGEPQPESAAVPSNKDSAEMLERVSSCLLQLDAKRQFAAPQ